MRFSTSETGLTVYTGPVEATALGNLVVQAWATGELESLQDGCDRIKHEHKVKIFFFWLYFRRVENRYPTTGNGNGGLWNIS